MRGKAIAARLISLSHTMSEPSTRFNPRYTGDVPVPCPRHVKEFQEIYEKRFGISLSSEQALGHLIDLLVIVSYRQQNAAYSEDRRIR